MLPTSSCQPDFRLARVFRRYDGLDIHVDTNNGKATLTGTAATSAEKDLAGRIARDTDGVVGVNNEIAVSGKPDTTAKAAAQTEQAVSDSWITSKVGSSLMFTRGVSSFNITATTLDGVVTLKGVPDSTAERELAIRATKDIRGVKKVDADGLKVG